jgi:hypothetical protein
MCFDNIERFLLMGVVIFVDGICNAFYGVKTVQVLSAWRIGHRICLKNQRSEFEY